MLRYVRLSEARQKKYYVLKEDGSIPLHMAEYLLNTQKYEWRVYKLDKKKRTFLFDIATSQRVIKNKIAQGTPKDIKINFQKIWNNEVSDHTRNKIALEMKESYQEALSKVIPIAEGFPLLTHFTVYSNDEGQDVDNLTMLYVKTFHDSLVGAGIIPDDKLEYLKRYSAGHQPSETDYIVVEIYSYEQKAGTTQST